MSFSAVFRHTEGKLPFFGILFENEQQALLNKEFVFRYANQELQIVAHKNYGMLYLSLKNDDKELHFYRSIKYNTKEYDKWRAYIHLKINFGHCYMKDGEVQIARTLEGKPYVLRIANFINF